MCSVHTQSTMCMCTCVHVCMCACVHVRCSLYRVVYFVCCSEDLGYSVSAVGSCVHCICVHVCVHVFMCTCVHVCVDMRTVCMCPCVGV